MISNSVIKAGLKFRVQAGDSFTRRFTFTDADGAAIDLSEHSFKMQVKDVEGTVLLEWLNAEFIPWLSTGVYEIYKTADEMDVTPGTYTYDLQVTYPGEEVRTWMFGNFEILNQTTL